MIIKGEFNLSMYIFLGKTLCLEKIILRLDARKSTICSPYIN